MAEGAKKGENHFWDWGLSYEAPFVTIGWKLWEKTSQNPKKALDNYYIDWFEPIYKPIKVAVDIFTLQNTKIFDPLEGLEGH